MDRSDWEFWLSATSSMKNEKKPGALRAAVSENLSCTAPEREIVAVLLN
jgi:hypothetical protein